ncbi:hypothetical protein V7S43_018600 [Phytophthora oleae]|uniref:Zinc finger PHD-type domain-containing protein n=1 Tax=Phytophthora oleae TaxID=2107226 RepID=A0ABD3EQ14_9STRA
MKCAFVDCINPKLPAIYPCSVCEREVHLVCSNDLYDPDNIACFVCVRLKGEDGKQVVQH